MTPGRSIALDARTRNMLSRSSEGLFETASPVSGVMVNLLGRLRTASVMDLADVERPIIDCITHAPQEETDNE